MYQRYQWWWPGDDRTPRHGSYTWTHAGTTGERQGHVNTSGSHSSSSMTLHSEVARKPDYAVKSCVARWEKSITDSRQKQQTATAAVVCMDAASGLHLPYVMSEDYMPSECSCQIWNRLVYDQKSMAPFKFLLSSRPKIASSVSMPWSPLLKTCCHPDPQHQPMCMYPAFQSFLSRPVLCIVTIWRLPWEGTRMRTTSLVCVC